MNEKRNAVWPWPAASAESKLLGQLILEAQRIREESWNQDLGEYAKSHQDASTEACKTRPEFELIVYLLNKECWNDVQMWAESQVK